MRTIWVYLLLTVAYVVAGKLGMMLALPPGYASPIFPSAGIAIAAAFIGGKKTLPWIFLGSWLLNIWVGYSANLPFSGTSFSAATIIATASMLQAAAGGWGLRRLIGYPAALARGHDILRFLLHTPLICLTSASLSVTGLWLLGLINPRDFAANFASWWTGDTLGVIVMFPLVMILAGEPRGLWKSRVSTVAVPIFLTFFLFVGLFLKVNQWETRYSLAEFRQYSLQAASQVQNRLDEQEFLLEQMAGLFMHDTEGTVTRGEFHNFVKRILTRFPMIQALSWETPMDGTERALFEAEQRKEVPGFEIRERSATGQLQRAAKRSMYYPVIYIEPVAGNESAAGFDLASDPVRQEALNKAESAEAIIASAAVKLVQGRDQQPGVLLLLSVNPHDRKAGTVSSVLRMNDFMNKLLADKRSLIYTRLIDQDDHKTIYDNFPSATLPSLYQRNFNFGTRHYRFETAPTPAYIAQHQSWQSWGVLAAGLLGTGLFGSLLLFGTGYTSRMKEEVEDRTRQLSDSEQRYQLLFNDNPMPMWVFEENSLKFLMVNDRAIEKYGYSREEFGQMTLRDVRTAEYMPELDRVIARSPEGVIFGEWHHKKKDGTPIIVSLSSVPMLYGTVPARITLIQDITARKQMEEAKEAALNLLSKIANNVPGVVYQFRLRPDGHASFPFVSEGIREIYRVSPEDVRKDASRILGIIHPEDLAEVGATIRKSARELSLWRHEYRVRFDDGTIRWLLGNAMPQKDADGSVLWHGFIADITERKQAEDALKISNQRFNALLSAVPDLMFELDHNGRYLNVWSNQDELLAASAKQLIGRTVNEILPASAAEETLAAIDEARLKGQSFGHQIKLSLPQGETWFELSVARLTGVQQTSYIVLSRDISGRKQAEEQIRNLAFYDPLTLLPNRRLLSDRLVQAMAASKRSACYCALMFLDLDNFKPLNDTHGHVVGDLLLIEAAARLKNCIREMDTVARFGGDEFVVILGELGTDKVTSVAQAFAVAEKTLAALSAPYWLTVHPDGQTASRVCHRCTASIGVAMFIDHEDSQNDIFKWADAAMYLAKASGRNQIRFYDAPEDTK
ncbi:MAG: PAS domain S-box protein [Gallionella sp.]|nr:PAS domain S-box protein [Gallionella sp.]